VAFLSCPPSGNRQKPVAGDEGLPAVLHHALHPHSSQPEFKFRKKRKDLRFEG